MKIILSQLLSLTEKLTLKTLKISQNPCLCLTLFTQQQIYRIFNLSDHVNSWLVKLRTEKMAGLVVQLILVQVKTILLFTCMVTLGVSVSMELCCQLLLGRAENYIRVPHTQADKQGAVDFFRGILGFSESNFQLLIKHHIR